MKESFSIVLVIIGAIIGAGFASGQEIYSFFYLYGKFGIYGIFLMTNITGYLIYKILNIIYLNGIDNYNEFLDQFIKNSKIKKIINIIINILLLISFFIMVAGFGTYFQQEIGISHYIGSIILAILCLITFFTNVKGVLRVSDILVPILILVIIYIGIKNLLSINNYNLIKINKNWILSSALYTSYNIILLIPVLISLRKQIKNKKNIKSIAIASYLILTILSLMIFMLLKKASFQEIKLQEMPVVYVISTYYPKLKNIYALVILTAIFTTSISVGIGFLQNICKTKKSYQQVVIYMCITSIIISNIGFSKLVNFTYPIFGGIGLIQVLNIIFKKIS